MKAERLLQSQGFGTRRECRFLIHNGSLHIDGEKVDDPSAELDVQPGMTFSVAGQLWQYYEKAYIALYKPEGCECSRKPLHHRPVFDFLPQQFSNRNVQCVGRLDQDTTGLLLLSDDGQFIHHWSSGKKQIPKTYEITTRHPVTAGTVTQLLDGMKLHDEPAPVRAAACEIVHEHGLHMVITEGKYHQVKRMIAATGNRVEKLMRIRVGGFSLPSALLPGEWRWLDEKDVRALSEF